MERYPGELESLRAETARLRRLLDLTEQQARAAAPDQTAVGTPVDMRSSPEAKVRFYLDLFGCRDDVYALRWENRRDGRSGWMPAIRGRWSKGRSRAEAPYLPLTDDVIAGHLRGDHHVGLYPLTDDDTCWWVAADFDKSAAMLDALAFLKAARAKDIPAALEVSQSGRGAHVWIFFAEPTPATTARRIATGLLAEAIQLRGSMSLSSYDRLFPSQDTHTGRGMGNLIAAPLNGTRRRHGTTLFLDPATLEPFDDQWAYLSSIPRLSPKQVDALAAGLSEPKVGHNVRRLQLPTSSKIVPRPAPIIRATFEARLQLSIADLGPAMISAVKHAASIPNPEFYTRQRARRSTWDTPRFLRSYDETLDGDLILPRGLLALLTTLVESADSTLNIDDNRIGGSEQSFTCASELRPEQHTALHAIESQDTCVLVAPPGTGKTVIACAAIASRARSTLILVDRKALADQWRTRILEYLGIKCGQIGGGRSKTTGVIDVALLPTLARRANVDELTRDYGFVVVDECHHIAASAFTEVLNQIPARYWLGLTATPYRRDQLDDLIYHQLGSHTHTIDAPAAGQLPASGDAPAPHRVLHVHPTQFAYDGDADPSQPGGIAEIYRALVADDDRLKQIVTDVLDAHQAGANILVLTTWVDHVDALAKHLTAAGCDDIITLRGGTKARERQAIIESIATRAASGAPLLLVGTGSYIGEGFDCPALDTLFLAAPVSFKGRLVQYAGRITRSHPGKTTATVHDYHDVLTPVIASSLRKRAPGYTELGFPDPRKPGH
ncbi:DEAD/DEAH box helicase [Nocardia seriolae]|uniref:DEAD/DEAH box helicase n=1 Tax=Nocardia seriolae TaxID=37332 RepID=UPI0004B624FD|nr:DEAD/DEAH box helicase [Nocardia seriolae]WKY52454.1 DEAD/DEAH box helicase family protein [Nocardia seriolae]WNJ59503.1 DEAD/DEAH box helicase family protein [Nocardia seriolae]BAW03481.1 helicase [Nocardia seriolae]BEK84267.1 DEAD/DEAH box helicase family protein [Nocardia seriolae]BEK92306.1 DEAD/DEAH box helicase family protein [Nocardia seriolae]